MAITRTEILEAVVGDFKIREREKDIQDSFNISIFHTKYSNVILVGGPTDIYDLMSACQQFLAVRKPSWDLTPCIGEQDDDQSTS